MIRYPVLEAEAVIGVTAPSSGVGEELRELLELAVERLQKRGYGVVCGPTAWTQEKAKSAPAAVRAAEFNAMMADESIGLVVPPWGGELLIEMLEQVDFSKMKCKWILGYSDISVLLLAVTLKTGIATAHGTNFIDLRGKRQTRQPPCGTRYYLHQAAVLSFSNPHSNTSWNGEAESLRPMCSILRKRRAGRRWVTRLSQCRAACWAAALTSSVI